MSGMRMVLSLPALLAWLAVDFYCSGPAPARADTPPESPYQQENQEQQNRQNLPEPREIPITPDTLTTADSPGFLAPRSLLASSDTLDAHGASPEFGSTDAARDSLPETADMSRYMTRRTYDCLDVSYNCFDLLPEFFYADQPDSVFALIDFWEDMCGPGEPILRAKILANIWTESFSETLYGGDIIDHLLWFQLKLSDIDEPWTSYLWKYPYYPPSRAEDLESLVDFDEFMADVADQLFPFTSPGTLERLYCHFYRGETDTLFTELKTDRYAGTELRQAYDADVAHLRRITDLDIAGYAGYWQPQGGLGRLGAHPTLGGLIGLSGYWWVTRLAGEMRLGNAAEHYTVYFEDDQRWTDHYFGVYFGFEGGLRLLRSRHHVFDLLGGVGYDGFEAISTTDESGGKWLSSVNLNATAALRFYFGRQSRNQIALEARLEDTYYDNEGGSDLAGHAWSLRLVIGWSGDKWRNRRLEALHTDRWGR